LQSKNSTMGLSSQLKFSLEEPKSLLDLNDKIRFSKNKNSSIEIRDLPPRGSQIFSKKREKNFHQNNNLDFEHNKLSKSIEEFDQAKNLSDPQNRNDVISKLCIYYPYPNCPKNFCVLGQFTETYIIAENKEELIFIEQKMLLERLIYETYMDLFQKKIMIEFPLNTPILIELSSHESEDLKLCIEPLENAGFSISHFGRNTFSVSSIPGILLEDKVESVIKGFVNLISIKKNDEQKIFEDICYTVAKYGTLNTVKKLNLNDMEFLLAKWEDLGSPLKSIQNKSMLLKISKQEIDNSLKS